jgi:hypothetical protein
MLDTTRIIHFCVAHVLSCLPALRVRLLSIHLLPWRDCIVASSYCSFGAFTSSIPRYIQHCLVWTKWLCLDSLKLLLTSTFGWLLPRPQCRDMVGTAAFCSCRLILQLWCVPWLDRISLLRTNLLNLQLLMVGLLILLCLLLNYVLLVVLKCLSRLRIRLSLLLVIYLSRGLGRSDYWILRCQTSIMAIINLVLPLHFQIPALRTYLLYRNGGLVWATTSSSRCLNIRPRRLHFEHLLL